ncbi:MAG TPA: MgtC/SapB family protein [Gammaproteobacteria bacterium]|nr:MgtC/SapB family protein [Gammaproteobacteria bacterium]
MDELLSLAVALAVGLLIGTERGWHERSGEEGSRIAGIRTFGLIGLLGGLWALVAQQLGELLLGVAFAAFAILVMVAYARAVALRHDVGITTVMAALVTFALGALAVRGQMGVAAAVAVVTASLLSLKPVLHRWLRHLEPSELYGALKLLLISVVLLPVLPNRGYGPWQALNPYAIWWLVVLIAGLSFAAYFAMKIGGTRKGIMLTSLLGGMVSSTAVTLSFSRLGRNGDLCRLLAAGVVAASATMFPRILLEVAVVNPALLPHLLLPMGTMTLVAYGGAWWLWRSNRDGSNVTQPPLRNPFELLPALQFGLLLALIMLASRALYAWFGERGIYLLTALSSIGDVDAIVLSLARMAHGELEGELSIRAIVLAAMVNTLVKWVLVFAVAGRVMGWRVGAVLGPVLLGGAVSLWAVATGSIWSWH